MKFQKGEILVAGHLTFRVDGVERDWYHLELLVDHDEVYTKGDIIPYRVEWTESNLIPRSEERSRKLKEILG